jgi:hypothetical protein
MATNDSFNAQEEMVGYNIQPQIKSGFMETVRLSMMVPDYQDDGKTTSKKRVTYKVNEKKLQELRQTEASLKDMIINPTTATNKTKYGLIVDIQATKLAKDAKPEIVKKIKKLGKSYHDLSPKDRILIAKLVTLNAMTLTTDLFTKENCILWFKTWYSLIPFVATQAVAWLMTAARGVDQEHVAALTRDLTGFLYITYNNEYSFRKN